MSFIRSIIEKRKARKSVAKLEALKHVFDVLGKMEKAGLLWFDGKENRLFIEEPLAMLMIADAECWRNFLQNCFTWQYYRQSQEAWNAYMLHEELSAVRHSSKGVSKQLTRQDVERIRYARRKEIGLSEMEPPKVEPFDFFIVKSDASAKPTSTEKFAEDNAVPGGRILCVGHYDPEMQFVEMALWEEVEKFLTKDK